MTAEFTVFQLLQIHDCVQMDKTVDISNNTFFNVTLNFMFLCQGAPVQI